MKMFNRFARMVSAVTLITFLSGCAATEDGRKTQAQGTAIGAAGGAALGALLGYATGGSQGAARGAVAGGVIGGAHGYAWGTHVAQQKAKYASTEKWLDGCIASARRANNRAYAYHESLVRKVAALEARSRAAIASRDRAAAREIRNEVVVLRKEAAVQEQQISKEIEVQNNVNSDKSARTAANYDSYRKEMVGLRQTKAAMTRDGGRLASLENQVNM